MAGTLREVAEQNTPQQVRVRLGKRERLLESGADPYPASLGEPFAAWWTRRFKRSRRLSGVRAGEAMARLRKPAARLPEDTSSRQGVGAARSRSTAFVTS